MAIGEFALGAVLRLLTKVITSSTSYAAQSYFQRRRIDRAVEAASASVIETFEQFFDAESVPEEHQLLLVSSCEAALSGIAENPSPLFEGSLDGEKVYLNIVGEFGVPQEIRLLHLETIYEIIFVRIATILCQVPAAVKNWEYEAWSENYKRLDLIADGIRSLFERVDAIDGKIGRDNVRTVSSVRRYLGQRIALKLDLTGLRGEKPMTGSMYDFFVHPEIVHTYKTPSGQKTDVVANSDEGLQEYLRRGVRAILVGAPGSGKSTWSRWFQRAALGDAWHGLPIRIELRAIDCANFPSLQEMVRTAVGLHYAEGISSELVDALAGSGDICLILDGLDEVSIADRSSVIDWIDDLVAFAPECSFVVTTRPLSTDHMSAIPSWKRWEILPFSADRVEDYVRRWYKFSPLMEGGTNEEDVLALTTNWRTDPTIGPLTGNPLLLSTLLLVHHIDGSLPSGRAELYGRYVNGMLGVWDDRRRVLYSEISISIADRRRILEEIAIYMQLTESDEISEDLAILITETTMKRLNIRSANAVDVLSAIRERSGLIIGPGVYNFAHKSISEYLVAQVIIDGHRRTNDNEIIDRFFLFNRRNADRWNVVLFLWGGSCSTSDLSSFIFACFEAGDRKLACGLIADQYGRIVAAGVDQFLPPIRDTIAVTDWHAEGSEWVVGGSLCEAPEAGNYWSPLSLSAPSALIASIAGPGLADFDDFLGRLCGDGYLSAKDLKGLKVSARTALWASLLDYPASISAYAATVQAVPGGAKRKRWLFWALERSTWRRARATFGHNAVTAEEKLNVLVAAFPDLTEVAVIAAISVVSQQLHVGANTMQIAAGASELEEYRKLLPAIVDAGRYQVNHGCLASTTRWEVWGDNDGESEVDLLENMSDLLLRAHVGLGNTPDYIAASRIVSDLKQLRDNRL